MSPTGIYAYAKAAQSLTTKLGIPHYSLVIPGTGSFLTRMWTGHKQNYLLTSKRFSDFKDPYNREYARYSYLFRAHRSEGATVEYPPKDEILQYGCSFTILRLGFEKGDTLIEHVRILTLQVRGHYRDTKVDDEMFWCGLGSSEFTKTSQPFLIGKLLWLPEIGEKRYNKMLDYYGDRGIEVVL